MHHNSIFFRIPFLEEFCQFYFYNIFYLLHFKFKSYKNNLQLNEEMEQI